MTSIPKLTAQQVADLAADLAEIERLQPLIETLTTRRGLWTYLHNVGAAALNGKDDSLTDLEIEEIGRYGIDGMIAGMERRVAELQARVAPFVEVGPV